MLCAMYFPEGIAGSVIPPIQNQYRNTGFPRKELYIKYGEGKSWGS